VYNIGVVVSECKKQC